MKKGNKGKRDPHKKDDPKHRTTTKEPDIRIGRPEGITYVMGQYNKGNKDGRYLQRAQTIYLNHYIHEGITNRRGEKMGLDEVSRFLRIEKREMLEKITGSMGGLLELSGDKDKLNRVILGYLTNGVFADRALIQDQVQNLKSAQGAGYVPFLSRDYHGALKLLLESQKPLIELLKALNPDNKAPIIPIQINQGTSAQVPGEKAISTTEALRLIEDNRNGTSLLEDPQAKEALGAQYLIGVPEIIATKQLGPGENSMPIKKRKKVEHIDRNEVSSTIVMPQ